MSSYDDSVSQMPYIAARLAVGGLPCDMLLREATNLFLPVFREGFVQVEFLTIANEATNEVKLVASFTNASVAYKMRSLLQGVLLDPEQAPNTFVSAAVLPGFTLENVIPLLPSLHILAILPQPHPHPLVPPFFQSVVQYNDDNNNNDCVAISATDEQGLRTTPPCDTLFLCRYEKLAFDEFCAFIDQLKHHVTSKWTASKRNQPVAFIQFETIRDAGNARAIILAKWHGQVACEYSRNPLGVVTKRTLQSQYH
jgi:hypothetical protein